MNEKIRDVNTICIFIRFSLSYTIVTFQLTKSRIVHKRMLYVEGIHLNEIEKSH
jgi:hypothetical protein